MDKSQEERTYRWNARKIWEDLNNAWVTLLEASEALKIAERAEVEAAEGWLRAEFDLQRTEGRDSTLFKAAKRLSGLYLSSETRGACGKVKAAYLDFYAAKMKKYIALQARDRALKAYQELQAVWEMVCAACARDQEEAKARARQMLGVSNAASPNEIKSAYREAAKRCHPDRAIRNGMSQEFGAELFRQINDAYVLLGSG